MNRIRLCVFGLLISITMQVRAIDTWYTPDPVNGMDTWFGSYYNQGGMPTSTYLKIGGWGDQYNSLLRFNLSGLPANAVDAAVCLYAFQNGGSPVAMNWYRVTSAWQENMVTWSNQPEGVNLGYTTPPATGWHCITITSFYNNWRTGNSSYLNHGFKYVPQATGNQFDHFYSSDYAGNVWLRPTLYVNSTTIESRIVLKWPVATVHSSTGISTYFGDPSAITCVSDGTAKQHNGVDYLVAADTAVYAPEDGFVREALAPSQTAGWASNLVLEHNRSGGAGKFTTVLWHITLAPGIVSGTFVPKGMQVGTIANLAPYGHGTHFHFGVRIGAYTAGYSGLGALPYANHPCDNRPPFPSGFIDHENTANVIFQ